MIGKNTARRMLFPSLCRAAFSAVALLALVCALHAQDDVHLVILHINDIHGKLETWMTPDGRRVGGIGRIATMVKQVREECPGRVLLLHAGDILSKGDALTIHDGGDLNFRIMGLMGFDALTPGNGDFYFGLDNLLRLAGMAKFPLLHANIARHGTERPPFSQHLIKEVAGVKVAILGVGRIATAHPAARHLVYGEPIAVAKELAPGLRQKSDLLIALTHIGVANDPRLAGEVPEIDVIGGGDSHTALQSPLRAKKNAAPGETIIVQAGDGGRFLGRLDLRLKRTENRIRIDRADGRLLPVDESTAEDEQVAAVIRKSRSLLDEAICTSEANLPNPPSGHSPAGGFVAEAIRAQTRADLAFLDRTGVGGGIAPGKVTLADACRIHPWRNKVLMVTCTGAQIKDALASLDVHTSGCSFQKAGTTITDLTIQGVAADPARAYAVATGDYLFWTTFLKALTHRETEHRVDELLVQHLRQLKAIR